MNPLKHPGSGEMALKLRGHIVLVEDPGSTFSTHIRQLTTTCISSSRVPNPLFYPQ